MNPNKVYIIGPEASGKSTLARVLSKKLKIKHYDLDDVVWKRRYDEKRTKKLRLKKLNLIIKKKKWIIEGIFGGWTEPVFKSSDLVIVLNLDYSILIKNLLKRSLFKRFKYEKEKTNIKQTLKLVKHVKKYRFRDHVKSYSGHKKLINKHNCNYIKINTKKELKNLLKNL